MAAAMVTETLKKRRNKKKRKKKMKLTSETLKRLISETMEEIEAAKARFRNAPAGSEERKEAFLAWQAASEAYKEANPIQKTDVEFPEPPPIAAPRVRQPSVDDIYNAPSDSAFLSAEDRIAIAAAQDREEEELKKSSRKSKAKGYGHLGIQMGPNDPGISPENPNMKEGLKITKEQLKQIIKEELQAILRMNEGSEGE
jgi:hypothetical protein